MKAIRVNKFGGPEVLQFEEVPMPNPSAGEVLIEVRAVGINPVETYLRSGSNPNLALPYTPGTDASGVVLAVGRSVRHIKVGARVYTSSTISGSYAEYTLCKENQVHELPSNMKYDDGAAINVPYSTAYRALFHRARPKEGDSVLIHGSSGGVGIAAVQLAREGGLAIIATAGTDRGCDLALREGAHHVFNHQKAGYQEEILALTEGEGVDIILEMLANINLGNDIRLLNHGGRVIVIGSRGTVEINPRDLMTRDADIRGMQLFNTPPGEMQGIHRALLGGFEKGALRPIIGQRFRLYEAAQAHEAVLRPGAFGKIVLSVEI